MFGAYQAGAWRAVSRALAPDIVVGASVGALNGWLIAAGLTGDELVHHWLDPASGDLMPYRTRRLPWQSMFDPQPLRRRAKLLVDHYSPRMDYGVVLLQLPGLRPKLFRNTEVTWQHLVASCAVPVGFPPVHRQRSLRGWRSPRGRAALAGRRDGRDTCDRSERLTIRGALGGRNDDQGRAESEEGPARRPRGPAGNVDHAGGIPGQLPRWRHLAPRKHSALDRTGGGRCDCGAGDSRPVASLSGLWLGDHATGDPVSRVARRI